MAAPELYLETEKFVQTEENQWTLPPSTDISKEGRRVVERDPNVTNETLNALVKVEWERLSDHDRDIISNLSKEEIADKMFFQHGEMGLAHVSQCILDDKDQSVGDLIASYAEDRRISYVMAAVYINALMSVSALYYYAYSPSKGYRKVRWEPMSLYVPPEVDLPPIKKKRRIRKKSLTSIPEQRVYPLYACPVCGSPAKLYRCGKNSRLWHACCDDEERQCINYPGRPPLKTEKMAMLDWNQYVLSATDNPVWSSDAVAAIKAKRLEEDRLEQ